MQNDRVSCYKRIRDEIGFGVDLSDELAMVLDGYPIKVMEAVILRIQGYSQKEIGERLGCNQQYVSKLLFQVVK